MEDALSTGPRPLITVRVCVPASDAEQYWIVSINDGWFAKCRIEGAVGKQTYPVELRHGSGHEGTERHFVVVAGRTDDARQWLSDNLETDLDGKSFDRRSPPQNVDEVSARVFTRS